MLVYIRSLLRFIWQLVPIWNFKDLYKNLFLNPHKFDDGVCQDSLEPSGNWTASLTLQSDAYNIDAWFVRFLKTKLDFFFDLVF